MDIDKVWSDNETVWLVMYIIALTKVYQNKRL